MSTTFSLRLRFKLIVDLETAYSSHHLTCLVLCIKFCALWVGYGRLLVNMVVNMSIYQILTFNFLYLASLCLGNFLIHLNLAYALFGLRGFILGYGLKLRFSLSAVFANTLR